jgi:hypothetical protein
MLPEVKSVTNSAGVAAKERRRDSRYSVSAMAEAVELQSDTRISGRISDIALGGCYLEVMSPFAVGSSVKLRITKDDKLFEAKAKVLYSTGGMGMGLIFTEVEPSQRPLLQRWIAELSGELAPEPKTPKEEQENRSEESSNAEQRYVLNELIITLIRKHVLTDAEGKTLLKKLML